MAKKFMYVCVGLMALAGAYSLGAQNTVAQGIDNRLVSFHITSAESGQIVEFVAATEQGDVYRGRIDHPVIVGADTAHIGNIFEGAGVVGSNAESLNDLKSMFK